MPKRSIIILVFLLVSSMVVAAYGEKFSTSSTTDFLKQRASLDLNSQTRGPQVPILPSMPVADATPVAQINTAPPVNLPTNPAINAPNLPETSLPSAPTPPPMTSLSKPEIPTFQSNIPSLEQTKISVPNFEKKWQEMLAKQAQQLAEKKKKTLWGSIVDEFMHYGIFLVLGLILLIVAYTVTKEQKEEKPEGEPQKDIWHEDF